MCSESVFAIATLAGLAASIDPGHFMCFNGFANIKSHLHICDERAYTLFCHLIWLNRCDSLLKNVFFFFIPMKIGLRAQHKNAGYIRIWDLILPFFFCSVACLFHCARFYSFLIFHAITSEQPHQNAHIYITNTHEQSVQRPRERNLSKFVRVFFAIDIVVVHSSIRCIISVECFVVDVCVCAS